MKKREKSFYLNVLYLLLGETFVARIENQTIRSTLFNVCITTESKRPNKRLEKCIPKNVRFGCDTYCDIRYE